MTIALGDLVSYWLGDLDEERSLVVEEALFQDAGVARRLDAVARLETGVRQLVREGRLWSSLSRSALDDLERAGLELRQYRIAPGQVVACTAQSEDFSVVRLEVPVGLGEVDLIVQSEPEGEAPSTFERKDVPVDTGEVILVFPGAEIRALPRCRVRYDVLAAGQLVGRYHLDHTPSLAK